MCFFSFLTLECGFDCVLVPDHCLSFHFMYMSVCVRMGREVMSSTRSKTTNPVINDSIPSLLPNVVSLYDMC